MGLTSVSAPEVVIGDLANESNLPCQRVHDVTVTAVIGFEPTPANTGFETNRLGHHAKARIHQRE